MAAPSGFAGTGQEIDVHFGAFPEAHVGASPFARHAAVAWVVSTKLAPH
jgi:hypothetical protein